MAVPIKPWLNGLQVNSIRATGRVIGNGAYATVLEYDFHGLRCVGKKIHSLLYENASLQEREDMLRRFAVECELLSRLHHPNIVQFLGIHAEESSELPALVMEYLPTTLSGCLDSHGALPAEDSYHIMHDVALGLRYLHEHTPPIVHRDLSANNVLLTDSLSAKIADLGVAKILSLSPAQMTQRMGTQAPGTPSYMPPEALTTQPNYTIKIDSFSFGVMILHMFCGRWPLPTDLFRPSPHDPSVLVPMTEIDRRAQFLRELGDDHLLQGLARRCLSNAPTQRPEAAEILRDICEAMSREPVQHDTKPVIDSPERGDGQTRLLLSSAHAEIESLQRQVDSLLVAQSTRTSLPSQAREFFHPHARIHWKALPNAPVEMYRAQAVAVGEDVFVGGGVTSADKEINPHLAFWYNRRRGVWSTLPLCPVKLFALANFRGELTIVGGADMQYVPTGKVYRLIRDFQQWEEFLLPMPTARYQLSVATTSDAIVAAGGATGVVDSLFVHCATVEVYHRETAQWHTTESLPAPCCMVSSVSINDTFYLMGARGTSSNCSYASITSLVEKAVLSIPTHGSTIWQDLPHSPFRKSVAACLSGALVAMGGFKEDEMKSPAIHVFLPLAKSWVKISSDLPLLCSSFTTVQVSCNEILLIGGLDEQNEITRAVFMGTVCSD